MSILKSMMTLKVIFLLLVTILIQGCTSQAVKPQPIKTCERAGGLHPDYYLEKEFDGVTYSILPAEYLKLILKESACLRASG